MDKPGLLAQFLNDFASIKEPKILVHGGGAQATKMGEQLGFEVKIVKGRRITDAQTLDLVTMVYGGLVNKSLVAQLQQRGCNAFGITGADGNMIHAVKRPVKDIDFGFVGDISSESINTSLLYFLLKQNTTPVFAPLTHDNGTMLNTNADTIASTLAIAMSKHFDVRLIFCFEKKGVLRDVHDNGSVIRLLTKSKYTSLLADGVFENGMLPKLENAYTAIEAGVKEILIGDSVDLIKNIGQESEGTLITK